MIFFYFLSFSISYVFGIDIGTEYTKISITNPEKGIYAAINQNSKRLTPSYFSIWDFNNISNPVPEYLELEKMNLYRWEFLDSAKSHYFRYPTHAVKGMENLLNRTHGLMRREILALFLRQMIATIEEQKYVPSETALVFAVEPTLKLEERVAIAETCKIANVTLFAIIESPSAAARLYSMEKRGFFSYGQKVVMFVDIGAAHTCFSVYRFEPNGQNPIVNEVSISYNSSLGGNLIDEVLADYLEEKFVEQNNFQQEKLELVKSKRMLFIEESCRVKEILSLNDVVNATIDDVVDNCGLNISVTRQEFDSRIEFFTNSLENIFNETIKKGKLSLESIDSIELLGGTTRIPAIQNLLKKLCNMSKLNRTMNSDEAVALGAGYFGAEMKDDFHFKPVKISYHLHEKIYLKSLNETVVLFNESNRNTDKARKIINLNSPSPNLDYTIYAGETPMLKFHLKPPETISTIKNEKVLITFAFNRFNAPFIYNISMNTGRKIKVTFDKPEWMLNSTQIKDSISLVRKLEEETKSRRKVSKIRNDYENFIIKILKKLEKDEIFRKVTSIEQQNEIKTTFIEHEKWINSMETDRIDVHELADKFIQLRSLTRDAEIRADLFVKRPHVFKKLGKLLRTVFHSLTVSWPIKKLYLPQTKLDKIWILYNETKEWYDKNKIYVESGEDAENLMVMPHEIEEKINELEDWFNETRKFKPIIKPRWTTNSNTQNRRNENDEKENSIEKVPKGIVDEVEESNMDDIDDEEEYYEHDSDMIDDDNDDDEDEQSREPQIYAEKKIEFNDFLGQVNKFKNKDEFEKYIDQMNTNRGNTENEDQRNYNEL